jgi:hypothetical protein
MLTLLAPRCDFHFHGVWPAPLTGSKPLPTNGVTVRLAVLIRRDSACCYLAWTHSARPAWP